MSRPQKPTITPRRPPAQPPAQTSGPAVDPEQVAREEAFERKGRGVLEAPVRRLPDASEASTRRLADASQTPRKQRRALNDPVVMVERVGGPAKARITVWFSADAIEALEAHRKRTGETHAATLDRLVLAHLK